MDRPGSAEFLACWSGGTAGWAAGQGADQSPQIPPPASAPAPAADKAGSYYHYLRAADLISRGSYTDAGAEFRLAIEASPGDADLLAEYAKFLIQTQNLSEAHKQLERCLQLNPDSLEAHRMLAGIYAASVGEGGPDPKVQELAGKAVAQYEEVLRLDPSDAQSLFALGRLYFRLQQPDKAEQYMKRFTERSDGSLEGFYYLTLIYAGQKKFDQALETLGNMEKLRPESMQIQLLKADILENLGRVEEAEKLYQRQIETAPAEPAPYQQFARMLLKNKKEDQALAVLELARTNLAADEEILSMLGQVYRDRRSFDKAIQAFKDAITLAPSQLDSRYQLGLTYAEMGDALSAIPIFQSFSGTRRHSPSSAPADPAMRRMFILNLGFLYMDTRKFSNAMGVFQGFHEGIPERPGAGGLHPAGGDLPESRSARAGPGRGRRGPEAARRTPAAAQRARTDPGRPRPVRRGRPRPGGEAGARGIGRRQRLPGPGRRPCRGEPVGRGRADRG